MDHSKISHASATCLTDALQTNRPFVHVRSVIDRLRKDPNWSEPEILELQTGVIRALMKHYGNQTSEEGRELDDRQPDV